MFKLWEQAVVRDGLVSRRSPSSAFGEGMESIGVGLIEDLDEKDEAGFSDMSSKQR